MSFSCLLAITVGLPTLVWWWINTGLARWRPVLLACLLIGIAPTSSATNADDSTASEHWLRVIYRDADTRLYARVLERDGHWFIRQLDLAALQLPEPEGRWLRDRGELFYPFTSLQPRSLKADTIWGLLHIDPLPPAATDRAADTHHPPEALRESWLELSVNGSDARVGFALVADDGHIYLPGNLLEQFRIDLAPLPPLHHQQQTFYAASSIPDAFVAFDRRQQRLSLYAPSTAFRHSSLSADRGRLVTPDFSASGGFFNYALFGSHTTDSDRLDGQFELGVFAGRALFTSSQLESDVAGDEHDSVRLESTLRMDWPESMRTLRLGDTVGFAGSWGLPVRFGGIQWGSNFGTQPGFITFPMPDIGFDTAVPSTVDVFVNNALRSSERVEAGPFTMQEVPVVTGSGEVRLVVRDLFGREQIITESFYASRELLRQGLHEYSYELGSQRRNFASASDDYDDPFIAGTHRYGFSNVLTGELRGELLENQTTLGMALNWLWPRLGEFQLSLAASDNRDQNRDPDQARRGEQVGLGFRRQGPRWGLGFDARASSAEFVQLGRLDHRPPDALQTRAFGSLAMGRAGSVTFGHVRQQRRSDDDIEFATLQYSLSLGGFANLGLNVFEPIAGDLQRSAQLSLSLPLGGRTSAQLSGSHHEASGAGGQLQLQRNLPAGNGVGYRLLTESGPVDRTEAGLQLRGSAATLTAEAARVNGTEEYRGSLAGGVAVMGGRPYLSRELDQSFAVVEVPGLAGIDIYRDNQVVARTGARGRAIVPGLRAFQENRVRVDNTALPMDREVRALEERLIPAFRQGLALRFDVRHSQWVAFSLYTEDEAPVPAGIHLRNSEHDTVHTVGFNGKVYIEGRPGHYRLEAQWQDQHCSVLLEVPETEELMPELGRHYCEKSKP